VEYKVVDSEPAAIDLRDLDASYRDGGAMMPVLAGLSLAVAQNEFVAVVGPSGSGKSTLLNIIAGLDEPDRGMVALDGNDLPAKARLGRTAYMHQRDLLFPWRTVEQNAALALEIDGVRARDARAAARARLPEFGLQGFGDVYPAQLSGGMRQRAAFLRTMLSGRRTVLLDEPFGALDALTRADMHAWLADRLQSEPRSALLVTHDIDEAIVLADRIVILSERPGHIVHIEPIGLARPRTREIVTEPRFIAHKASVLAQLGRPQ
jgi:ABC-type nitrate/sulfonate/bicarbonate transport system ATPase subunit